MACIKTNSNSITSILTIALNQDSDFRQGMLKLFEKVIRRKIDSTVKFYNCSHSPLLYEEMNGKEIDIIARIPGKHKPVMMIEVKANIMESLQESQNMKGEYQRTAKKHDIPLVYIIPENYIPSPAPVRFAEPTYAGFKSKMMILKCTRGQSTRSTPSIRFGYLSKSFRNAGPGSFA